MFLINVHVVALGGNFWIFEHLCTSASDCKAWVVSPLDKVNRLEIRLQPAACSRLKASRGESPHRGRERGRGRPVAGGCSRLSGWTPSEGRGAAVSGLLRSLPALDVSKPFPLCEEIFLHLVPRHQPNCSWSSGLPSRIWTNHQSAALAGGGRYGRPTLQED